MEPKAPVVMRRMLPYSFIPLLIALQIAAAAPHPLSPLTADEIRAATRIFRASSKFPADAQFSILTLDEPPKAQVLAKANMPRRAFAVIYDHPGHRTFEATANHHTIAPVPA